MRTSEQECLRSLREAAERLGKSPTKAEYEELGLGPASTTILRRFGSWNDAKKAADLETFEQSDGGGVDVQSKPDWVDIPDDRKWDELTAQQRWYYKNRDHRIEVKETRRENLQEWYAEIKRSEMECERCGEQRAPSLDLHHENEKTQDVSEMVNDGYAKDRIREEIARCTVLCANCHRKRHYEGPDPGTLGFLAEIERAAHEASGHEARRRRRTWLLAYKDRSDGCSDCSSSHPACLDFHHEQEKTMRISQMVSFGRSLEEIRQEIDNCVLLCANCHRQRHFEESASDD